MPGKIHCTSLNHQVPPTGLQVYFIILFSQFYFRFFFPQNLFYKSNSQVNVKSQFEKTNFEGTIFRAKFEDNIFEANLKPIFEAKISEQIFQEQIFEPIPYSMTLYYLEVYFHFLISLGKICTVIPSGNTLFSITFLILTQ